ncbi:MAG: hypothetical protein FJ090_16975 [Deltaproteobacteria bacterium]|nr:hypothetical protein [Deltaproteobacteria bacterium]
MFPLLACAPHPVEAPRVQERAAAANPAVATEGCEKLDPALWRAAASTDLAQVVLDITAPTLLPKLFEVEAETALSIQGRVPGDYLCTLAALPAVTRVRPPAVASPKVEP